LDTADLVPEQYFCRSSISAEAVVLPDTADQSPEHVIVRKTLLILSFLAICTTIGFGATQADDLPKLVITQTMNQARISVQPDETFTIKLWVDSDNGLQWYLEGYDPKHLEYCGQVLQVPVDQDSGFFGTQHAVRFKLRAREAGESQVRFLYYRPWEGPALAEKEFEVAILVAP
jgi:predicted secreted protein